MTRAAMTRPVCVVGGSGQIGERLVRAFAAQGVPIVATYYCNERPGVVQVDAAEEEQVKALMARVRPRLVINSLNAKGGTDACEADPALAQRAHFSTARHLVDAAREVGARFVQLSTDYVFDGRNGPYAEVDRAVPLSQLGRAKLQAEQYALARLPGSLIVRTSFVFSWTPRSQTKNFMLQLLEHDRRGDVMRVPTDQVGNVTYAPNLADALVELVGLGASGVYHVAGTTRCSKYEWALQAADFFGLRRNLIQGVPTAQLGQVGPRPLASGFRLEKVQAALRSTKLLSLEEGLIEMEREMGVVRESLERS